MSSFRNAWFMSFLLKNFLSQNFLEIESSSFSMGMKSEHGELVSAVLLLSRFYLKTFEVILDIYLVCQNTS